MTQEYFSLRFDLNAEAKWDFASDVVQLDSTYIIHCEGPLYGNQRRIAFFKIDLMGNPTGSYKIYSDSTYSFATGYAGCFVDLMDSSGFILAASKIIFVPNGRLDQGFFMRFDNNLDTIWTKSYIDAPPHDSSLLLRNIRETWDQGFIIVGGYAAVEGGAMWRIRLLRTDSLGQVIWDHYYGSGNTDYLAFDVTNTADGGYAIAGCLDQYNGTTQDVDPIVIKTDSLGNQQWLKHFGNPICRDDLAFIDLAHDGNIQVGTIYSDVCSGSGSFDSRINLIKLRNDGSVVWDKKYALAKRWRSLNKVKVLSGGDIVAVGDYQFTSVGLWLKYAWMLRTDSAGNELWYREFNLMQGDGSENTLYNVIQTSDRGFAACGSVFPASLPDTGTQDSWVLKVDSLGCVAPGECWVGEDEIWVKTFTPEKPFIVYPNPARDKLFVEFYNNPDGAVIELYNLYGQREATVIHPPARDIAEFDLTKLPPGMYIVRVFIADRVIGTERVVKQ